MTFARNNPRNYPDRNPAANPMWRRRRRPAPTVDLAKVLAATASVIDEHGWVSKGQANEDPNLVPTASRVEGLLNSGFEPSDPHLCAASTAIDYWRGNNGRSEYEWKCRDLARAGSCSVRALGIACSMLTGAFRGLRRQEERRNADANPQGAHLGAVGSRIETVAKLVSVRYDVGRFSSTLCKFEDADGNLIVWWASRAPHLQQGATYTIRGTVKKHDSFNGQRQTVVTRCAVVGQ